MSNIPDTMPALVSPSRVTYPIEADGEQVVEPHFSWRPCDYGESKECQLGGDRYDIEYYQELGSDELEEMEVCSDCYYLLMMGERPDNYGS